MKNETTETLPASVVKSQVKTYGPKFYTEGGTRYRITAKVRYDDQCGNGHNSFSITADIDRQSDKGERGWQDDSCGCCHDEVAKHFPELAPFIKWHLTSSDGPMHYVANTVYHALEHGAKSAWVYLTDEANDISKQCLVYTDIEKAAAIVAENRLYSMEPDPKTAKVRNLEHAKSCAVWPDATEEDLTAPGLEDRLMARLPALMAEFKTAVESLGFTY